MNYLKFYIFLLLMLVVWGYSSTVSLAHNGDLDELGGHFRNKDCVYLLHEPTSLVESASNVEELIILIQKYNSNDCKHSLTADRVDLEGHQLDSSRSSTENKEVQEVSSSTPSSLQLGSTYPATLERCVDGDTAVLTVNGTSYNTRFLFIDTPEYTSQKEPFGKEASAFTCDFLEKGDITVQTDGKDLFDKYDRLLAWVFVGDKLHQEEITKLGLVEDFYDYGDYIYEDTVLNAMEHAKANEVGIYGGETEQGFGTWGYILIGVGIVLTVFTMIRKLF
ncbi:endonuclease YncB(thermonuclease family) [Bacillus mesophilus]|uniref:Nuclease n=1 Tax=Bacillus mesophilus TaxID=1808955 RepID=A0A6M0QAT7_9BACI|nr:thermonuclease family protein [Bacillus mesophilus]MBM7662506.1 endonuclease YncB(thermonuclease family) [Bacillus mesophilus]NEY72869.1 nuclease [Bacillus mesophilus]